MEKKRKPAFFTNSPEVLENFERIRAADAALGITDEDMEKMTTIEYLKTKKERGGKLNKLGEWLLAREEKGDEYWIDMRAVLK